LPGNDSEILNEFRKPWNLSTTSTFKGNWGSMRQKGSVRPKKLNATFKTRKILKSVKKRMTQPEYKLVDPPNQGNLAEAYQPLKAEISAL